MSNALSIRQQLEKIRVFLQDNQLWEAVPPPDEAFLSQQPFAMDCIEPEQWLQWILLPRMEALLEGNFPLPSSFLVTAYFEEALKERTFDVTPLLQLLAELDALMASNRDV